MKALENLPPTLDETYNRILSTISAEDIPYATRILRWLAFSLRPLLLSEVSEVAALDAESSPGFDRDEVLEDPLDVLSICSSLVAVVNPISHEIPVLSSLPKEPVVLLAHYSVKEYLVSERILNSRASLYGMESILCHRIIAKGCIRYLLQFDSPDALTESNLHEFAPAKYSAQKWILHFAENKTYDKESIELILGLLNAKTGAYLTWVRLYKPDEPYAGTDFGRSTTNIAPPLYFASQAGLTDIIRRLVDDLDIRDSAQNEQLCLALGAASQWGRLEASKVLLEKGVDIIFRLENMGSALRAASFAGHSDVAQFLIEKGASVNAQMENFDNALQAASVMGHLEVAKLLIEKGAKVNTRPAKYGDALQAASSEGHLGIVKLLVEKGADIHARYDGDPLQTAAYSGYLDVVQYVVEKGADVNSGRGKRGKALHAASYGGYVDIVRFLVEKGAEVDGQAGEYSTALQAASCAGSLAIVQLLVEKEADVNAEGRGFGTALQAAALGENLHIAQFLVEKGADINAPGEQYGTALEIATNEGYVNIARFLVDKGAIPKTTIAAVDAT